MEKAESYANSAAGDAINEIMHDEESDYTLDEIVCKHLADAFYAGYKSKEEEAKQ